MSAEEFDILFNECVVKLIFDLPEDISLKLQNVVMRVQDEPDEYTKLKIDKDSPPIIFGVFEGIPLTQKMDMMNRVLIQDQIILYQDNIEKFGWSDMDMKQRIDRVLKHEVAHYFGMTDDELRAIGKY